MHWGSRVGVILGDHRVYLEAYPHPTPDEESRCKEIEDELQKQCATAGVGESNAHISRTGSGQAGAEGAELPRFPSAPGIP